MLSIPHLNTIVGRFDPQGDSRSDRSRGLTLDLLGSGEAALDRRNYAPGHVTASGIVLSMDQREVLLVFHRKLGRWLQPGGHIETTDHTAAEAAAREIREETGVTPAAEWEPTLVGIDVHEIPAREREPTHLHHDIVWRFQASVEKAEPPTDNIRCIWCPIPDLPKYAVDHPMSRAVERALNADWVRRTAQSVE